MTTATTQIMEYVKNFMAIAIEEKWSPELIQQTWQEKNDEIKDIVEKSLPKKTKISSQKDPNKPKRGRAAYLFFCGKTREEVKADLGDVKPQQVMSELGNRWKELKESTQQKDKALIAKYTKMAEEDKMRAETEMATYVPPTDDELLANKPKRGRKPSPVKKSDKPKRARTNYIFFCTENRQDLKDEYPEKDGKSITKILSEMWYELKEDEDREDELQKYIDMSNNDKKRYEKEMETYVQSDDDEEEASKKKAKTTNKIDDDDEEEKPKKKSQRRKAK